MSTIDTLLTRASVSDLTDPAPDGGELETILQAGLRAPDHGRLRPWRFVLIRGDARRAWAETIVAALLAREPDAPEPVIAKQRTRVLNAPLIIALGVKLRLGHKIPEIEQMLSVGAAAMNMLNAAHALGYGAVWLTGAHAFDPLVVQALGLEGTDKLAGFLFVGTPKSSPLASRRPELADHVVEWTGAPPSIASPVLAG
ncbi:MAG: nitroreductase [Acetobacteraceae bacterium]|nr:nitroreductase [Acetobacteraceae bacterium]